jgi:SSS family solute:Na+ symporter
VVGAPASARTATAGSEVGALSSGVERLPFAMLVALAAPDYLVMAAYGALVLAIGWLANRRQKNTEDYFLGGRRLPWWAIGVSLVATSFSSVSLVGGTGFGYSVGMQWLQLQIGDLLAILLVCAIFLPFFSSLSITTAYEYLEKRFGVRARTVASALFLGQTLLRTSILVYSPALILKAILGWSIGTSILVTAGAAIIYSTLGGIGAVVWTDVVQLLVILVGVGTCILLTARDVSGGLASILDWGRAHGYLDLVTLEFDPSTTFNAVGALVPYMVLAFSLFGTGQQAVQRFLSVKDLKSARRAALTAWAVGTATLGTTLFLGVAIAAWSALGAAPRGFPKDAGDAALAHFIELRLPTGLAGLLLAAIFAASMSSMDSAIHSMSTAFVVDFKRRFGRRGRDPATELRTARAATFVIGILAIGGAFLAAGEGSILGTLVTWLGYFAGPLLGLFLLGMVSTRATERGALIGVALAFAFVAAGALVDLKANYGIHPLWMAPASACLTFLIGLAASGFEIAPGRDKLDGLTLFTR